MIDEVWSEILLEREGMFYNYRNLLTEFQFILLKSIAKEKRINQPYVKEFLRKYNLGTPSTVATALKALLKKNWSPKKMVLILFRISSYHHG